MIKKTLILLLLILLTGCSSTPEEQLLECMNSTCEEVEKSEAVLDYINTLDPNLDIYNFLEGYTPLGALFHSESTAQIGIIYENEQLSYADGFDQLDSLYQLFLSMESGLLQLETTKELEITTMLFIEEGINDYNIRFKYIEDTNDRHVSIDMHGFQDDHDVFMNTLYLELPNIVEYTNDDFDIRIYLITDIGHIHINIFHDSNTIDLDYNDDAVEELYQSRLADLVENLESALSDEYTVNVTD